MNDYKIYCANSSEYVSDKIRYLTNQKDIIELIINSDVEEDYESFSLSGIMIRSNKYLYPVGAGFDIGCGVSVFKTNIKLNNKNIIEFFSYKTPFGIRRRRYELIKPNNIKNIDKIFQTEYMGDIETGNHFIEIRTCNDEFYIVIHSGISYRMKMYFAQRIINLYKIYFPEKLDSDNLYLLKINKNHKAANLFLEDVKAANNFASENRKYIAEMIAIMLEGKVLNSFSSPHEYIVRDGNDVVHCNGTQEFIENNGIMSAIILCGCKRDNYIVENLGKERYINHGTNFEKNNELGERIYSTFTELIQQNRFLKIKPILILKPFCACKKEGKGYEYTLF